MARPSPGRVAFWLRRGSGVLLTLYLGLFIALLPRDGSAMLFGDAGRLGPPLFKLVEMALIFALCLHAADALSAEIVVWLDAPSRRPLAFGLAAALAVVVTAWHVPYLF